jgi:hypothetical protein
MRFQMNATYLLSATLLLGAVGCSDQVNPRVATKLNQEAALVGDLPSNPLKGRVITSWVSKKDSTMSTLYGNEVAVKYARMNPAGKYPVGSVLSAVTWSEQEDPRWFGAKIPGKVRSVEFVTVTERGGFDFERYEGMPLKRVVYKDTEGLGTGVDRAAFLMSLRAAVMP